MTAAGCCRKGGGRNARGAGARTGRGVCVWLVLMLAAAAARGADVKIIPFTPGEKLSYVVRVWLGWDKLGMSVGTAEFLCDQVVVDGERAYQFQIVANGGAFGYRVRSRLTSQIDADTLKSIRFAEVHAGSEKRKKRLEFTPTSIAYWKYSRVRLANGKKTQRRAWRLKRINEVDHPFCDMLSALYLARGFDLGASAAPQWIDVADAQRLWRLQAKAGRAMKLSVPAGTFQAVAVDFKSTPLNHDAREKQFTGLFGMKGAMQIWVDTVSRRILRIRGTIRVGINLKVDISLAKVEE